MVDERQSADEVMEQARRQFVGAARGTLEVFEQLGAVIAARPDAEEPLATMQRDLHRLHGSAATFGLPRVGRMAAALESAIKRWVTDSQVDRDRRAPIIARFAQSLRNEMAASGGVAPALPGRRLLIVGLKDAAAVPLTTEASARGFQVERLGADELDEVLDDGRPDAVIAAAGIDTNAALHGVALLLVDAGPVDAAATLDALDALVAAAAPAEAGSVLVVDDDPVMRTLVQVACAQAHLAVTVAADAGAFRGALQSSTPSVIVIDIEVGDVNGLDLVREARANAPSAGTPVLVLSGHTDTATREAAIAAGATDYLMKPISLPVLAAKLAAWGTRSEIES